MTETEWLACGEVTSILGAVLTDVSERKLRLFAVACTRRIQHLFRHELCKQAVDTAELFVDELATDSECRAVFSAIDRFHGHIVSLSNAVFVNPANEVAKESLAKLTALSRNPSVAIDVTGAAVEAVRYEPGRIGWGKYYPTAYFSAAQAVAGSSEVASASEMENGAQCLLLRDIVSNPFRPVAFSSSWRTDTARALAAQMYESREFTAMPILADALQDAGCDSDDLLDHCRAPCAPHVRGCWVVDLVLGKQ